MNYILIAILGLFSFPSFSRSILKYEKPELYSKFIITTFNDLPLEGSIFTKKKVWPGSHWQNYLGNISYRWSASSNQSFTYSLYTKDELFSLEAHKVNELSPSEKFDLLRGDYSFSLSKSLIKKYSPSIPTWHGICHGLAAAALHHIEPNAITVKNDDGLEIEFYSSDIKGLLSYFYAFHGNGKTKQVGKRCFKANSSKTACQGLNPGSFHAILANINGVRGESFAVDIDSKNEVWNHLVRSYSSYIVNEAEVDNTSSPQAVKRVRVQTEVEYAGVIVPKFDPVIGTENESYFQQNYDYYLELDRDNNIVGGEWISDLRPDFIWYKEKSEFTKQWSLLKELVK